MKIIKFYLDVWCTLIGQMQLPITARVEINAFSVKQSRS